MTEIMQQPHFTDDQIEILTPVEIFDTSDIDWFIDMDRTLVRSSGFLELIAGRLELSDEQVASLYALDQGPRSASDAEEWSVTELGRLEAIDVSVQAVQHVVMGLSPDDKSGLLFPGVVPFFQALAARNEKAVVVTKGESQWQSMKAWILQSVLVNKGIEIDVYVVRDNKAQVLRDSASEYGLRPNAKIVDDRAKNLQGMPSGIDLFQMSHPDEKVYGEEVPPEGTFQVKSLNELLVLTS